MKIVNSMAFSFVRYLGVLAAIWELTACSAEEKKEPIPDLPPIDLPKDVPGLYSGSMPCDDCTTKMIRMVMNADSTVDVVQTKIRASAQVDSLKGVYVVTDSAVKVTLPVTSGSADSVHWNYKRSKSGNLVYLNAAGSVYEDENGVNAELIRIFKAPAKGTQE